MRLSGCRTERLLLPATVVMTITEKGRVLSDRYFQLRRPLPLAGPMVSKVPSGRKLGSFPLNLGSTLFCDWWVTVKLATTRYSKNKQLRRQALESKPVCFKIDGFCLSPPAFVIFSDSTYTHSRVLVTALRPAAAKPACGCVSQTYSNSLSLLK